MTTNSLNGYTTSTDNDTPGLTMADIEKAWRLLKSICEQPKLYYAVSEYLPQNDGYYKIKTSEGDLWAMHPSLFPQFELHATLAGYRLIDIRQMPLNLPRMHIDGNQT